MSLLYAQDTSLPQTADQRDEDQLVLSLQQVHGGGFGIGRWVRQASSSILLKSSTNANIPINDTLSDVSYALFGDTMVLSINLVSINIPAAATLYVQVPDGFQGASRSRTVQWAGVQGCVLLNGGVWQGGFIRVAPASPWVEIWKISIAAFTADTAAAIYGQLCFECVKGN